MTEEFDEDGYYDDFGEWIDTKISVTKEIMDNIDSRGRLIDQQRHWELSQPDLPEDFNLFLSKYEQPWMSSQMDWEKGKYSYLLPILYCTEIEYQNVNFIRRFQACISRPAIHGNFAAIWPV